MTDLADVPRAVKSKWEALKVRVERYRHNAHTWLHEGHSFAHLAYFAGVFWEGHGFYSSMGGVLLLMGVVAMFLGESDGV